MGDLADVVERIKNGEKDQFIILVNKLKPLILKYARKLYKDDREDMESEFILALWESIGHIKYAEDDGKLMSFFCRSIYIRFLELYRASCKLHNYEVNTEDKMDNGEMDKDLEALIIEEDMRQILKNYSGIKFEVYQDMIIGNLTDNQISQKYKLSRQYVNRLRRMIRDKLASYIKA